MTMNLDLFGSAPTDMPDKIGGVSVTYGAARDILTNATGFMDAYDFTLNPYSGCSFGCSYCYAAFFRYSEAESLTWGEWVRVKENAVDLLNKRKRGELDGKLIYMSSVTDPYQPVERKLNLTRRCLELMAELHKVRLVVQTRSPLVVRDIDLFQAIERNGGRVQVNMTVTTDDEEIRKAFERGCPGNEARLDAIADAQAAGVQSCVTMTPLLPVEDPWRFANRLNATGVKRFIAQPFHGEGAKMVAGTRKGADAILLARLWPDSEIIGVWPAYAKRYELALEAFRARLPNLGEGKRGFAPPF